MAFQELINFEKEMSEKNLFIDIIEDNNKLQNLLENIVECNNSIIIKSKSLEKKLSLV